MKKVWLLLLSVVLLCSLEPVLAQKDVWGGATPAPFKIRVSPGEEQISPNLALLGAVIPAVNVTVEGVSGSGAIYGIVVELRGEYETLEAVEDVLLLNGDDIWATKKARRRLTLAREFWPSENSRWNFTVAVRMRDTLSGWNNPEQIAGKQFSVAVVAVLTGAEVQGSFPAGPRLTVNLSQQSGRVTVRQFPTIAEPNLLPFLNHRWIFAAEFSGNSIEQESLPWVAIDLYASGGSVGDLQVVIVDEAGKHLGGPTGVEESLDESGKGTAYFRWPFHLEKGAKKTVSVGVRLGHSWTRGGTISASMVPSHSIAHGNLYGYRTTLLPHAVLAGPVFTVKAIAEKYEVKQLPIMAPLIAGRNDLVRFSVTAPPDKDVVIPGFGLRLGWLPVEDEYDKVMLYAFTDNTFSAPFPGLQSDGAFQPRTHNIEGMQHFSGFEVSVVRGNENQNVASGLHLLPGQTAYFAARADLVPSGLYSVVGTIVTDPSDWRSLAIQIRGR